MVVYVDDVEPVDVELLSLDEARMVLARTQTELPIAFNSAHATTLRMEIAEVEDQIAWLESESAAEALEDAAVEHASDGEAVTVHELTNSWRLGPQTCALVSAHFYQQMPFTSRRPDESVIAPDGTVLPEIVNRPTEARNGPTDPALLTALAERVRELTWHDYRRGGVREALTARDIAVVVPHVAQAGAVRALLADMPDVLIGTVNALQGLERPAVLSVADRHCHPCRRVAL